MKIENRYRDVCVSLFICHLFFMKLYLIYLIYFLSSINAFIFNRKVPPVKPVNNPISDIDRYNLLWFVVAQTDEICIDKPYKVVVWDKSYAIWKTRNGTFYAVDDICSHRGVSLSTGKICDKQIVCPYHAFAFDGNGVLQKVPGLNFTSSPVYNLERFSVIEKNGWIYLNTAPIPTGFDNGLLEQLNSNIFLEPEATDRTMDVVLLNMEFNTCPRLVSENSLDVMHIGYVHTFGNSDNPAPTYEFPPRKIGLFHFRTSYGYISGSNSMVKKLFKLDTIDIENEFILPHTTVARIKFGEGLTNTVITAACPISANKTRLFVKTYRNFMRGFLGNAVFRTSMKQTLLEDKGVIENIDLAHMDGKFNMKYDKLQNTYRTFYKWLVHA